MKHYSTIIGVDPSVAKTGVVVARLFIDQEHRHVLIDTRTKRGQPKSTDPGRLVGICERVVNFVEWESVGRPLLVIEGHAGQRGYGAVNIALHWMLRYKLARNEMVDTLVIAPTTLKKFATGDGRAEKGTMAAQIVRRWGHLLPADVTEDVLDALALVQLGRCWMDVPGDEWPQFQRDIAMHTVGGAGSKLREVEHDWASTSHSKEFGRYRPEA